MHKKIVHISWLSPEDIRDYDKLNYRRFKISKFLKEYYGKDYFLVQKPEDLEAIKIQNIFFDICYVSKPYKILHILPQIKYNKLIYDRSDNWSGQHIYENTIYSKEETFLLENANKILYVSRNMLDNKYQNKMIYVTNGVDVLEYDNTIEKYPKNTAIYMGRSSKKVNFNWLEKTALFYNDWDFLIYGISDEIKDKLQLNAPKNIIWKGFLPEKELFKIIEKCHVGLIPFVNKNPYVQGMCPLKLFQYCNAHIPTAYLNSPECSFYPNIAFDLNVYNLNYISQQKIPDAFYNKVLKEHNWKNIFENIVKIIESI